MRGILELRRRETHPSLLQSCAQLRLVWILSDIMRLSVGFKKSTAPQNGELNSLIGKIER